MNPESERQLPAGDRSEQPDASDDLQLVPTVAGESARLEAANLAVAGDTVTVNTAWMPPEQRALVLWLYAWFKESGMTGPEFQHDSDIDTSTLSRVWNDRYRYPLTVKKDGIETPHPKVGLRVGIEALCERIKRYKELCEARAFETRAPFIETSVWNRVDKICQEALVMQAIAFIYGESQVGKTEALKQRRFRNNHGQTVYVLTPAGGGKLELLQAIARAMKIPTRITIDQLKFRIGRYLGPTITLILDEVHEFMLSYTKKGMQQCLAILRQLQESSGCGLVLCGTNAFRKELEEGEFSKAMTQLRRRGIWELQLEDKPTWEDLGLIAGHYKLGQPTGEAREHVEWLRNEMGLGKYCKFLARASQLAKKQNDRMTWDHFTKVINIAAVMKAKPTEKTK
jgi:DNA transposition AAA+ family ATPase